MPSQVPTTIPAITPSSWRLLAQARCGHSSAVARLVLRYWPRLRRWARGRLPIWARTAADTSDLLQDVLLNTLSRLDVFQPQGRRALRAYLRVAVRNRIADEQRRASRWVMSQALDTLPANEPTPLQRAIDVETECRYRAALECLGSRDRELIVAHLERDYSHAQLGCMIGRSPNAARMALCRAIGRLAEYMRAQRRGQ